MSGPRWWAALVAVFVLWLAPGCSRENEAPTATPTPAASGPSALAGPSGAMEALQRGDLRSARTLARRELARRPQEAEAHRVLSEVEFAAGDYDLALAEAQEAARLGGEGDTLLTLARVQLFTDPKAALETARKLDSRDPGGLGTKIMLADATMYAAVARGAKGQAAKAAAREARGILEPLKGTPPNRPYYGDYLAVLGNSYLLEGKLPEARKIMEKALQGDIGMHDRVTDLASALAWMAFLQGDREGAAGYFGQALEALEATSSRDGFQLLPKWENYHLLRLAFTGEESSSGDLKRLDGRYGQMRGEGFQDQGSFREDRQLFRALQDAWDRKDYGQGFYLLAGRALPQTREPNRGPERKVESGEKRVEPGCFYRLTVEEPANRLFVPVFLGDLARRAGQPKLARHWYEQALAQVPGNPLLKARMKGLPAGVPPEDLGAPGPDQTLRILDRMAREGWSDMLLDGLEALTIRGTTRSEFAGQAEARDPRYEKVRGVLEEAVAGLDSGARFEVHLGGARPADREAYGETDWWGEGEALLDYGGPRPLRMNLEDHLWRITGFGEAAE